MPERLTPRIMDEAFVSSSLGREMHFMVVKPEHGGPDTPVLYLLHGRGRNRLSLVNDPTCRDELLQADCWVMLPDGDDGWYSNTPRGRYASYLEEVVQVAEARCALAPLASRRAIAGWSMGGYGAVRFAEAHPQFFSVVVSVIGLLDFPRPSDLPAGQNYPVPTAYFGSDPAGWDQFNPIHHINALSNRSLLLITATDSFDRTMNERFSDALTAAGIPHEFRLLQGGHTFAVVRTALPLVLDFVRQTVRQSYHENAPNLSRGLGFPVAH